MSKEVQNSHLAQFAEIPKNKFLQYYCWSYYRLSHHFTRHGRPSDGSILADSEIPVSTTSQLIASIVSNEKDDDGKTKDIVKGHHPGDTIQHITTIYITGKTTSSYLKDYIACFKRIT